MSDKDKLIILVLFFVFFASFFGIFIFGPDRPDSELFQYLFFIAALTMAFTGFLGSTGTFTTTGQTLGGGAAIFIVMGLVIIMVRPHFGEGKALQEIKQALYLTSPTIPKLTPEEVVTQVQSKLADLNLCQANQANKPISSDKLTISLWYLNPPRLIKPEDDLFEVYAGTATVGTETGKYEVSLKELANNILSISPRYPEKVTFGPEAFFKYNPNIQEAQMFVWRK